MRNKIKKVILLFITILIVEKTPAHDAMEGDILASLGPTVNQVIPLHGPTFSDKAYHTGLALLIEAGIKKNFGIELGVFNNQFQYYRETSNYKTSEQVFRVHIPIMFRYWLFSFMSLAAGPFASYKSGESEVVFLEGQWQGNLTSANDMAEHGVESSLMFDIPLSEKFFITTDFRYSYSLTPREFEARELKIFSIALKYLIQRNKEQ